jgi:hypothetical protein
MHSYTGHEVETDCTKRIQDFDFKTSLLPKCRWEDILTPGVKRQGHEAGHSCPSSAEVKNVWSYTNTPNTPSWRDDQSTGIT